jgi:hypothetical protein
MSVQKFIFLFFFASFGVLKKVESTCIVKTTDLISTETTRKLAGQKPPSPTTSLINSPTTEQLTTISTTTKASTSKRQQKSNFCVHYPGVEYDFVSTNAVALLSQQVSTVNTDPTPCCQLCHQTEDCSVYSYEIKNGFDAVCKLYSLPQSLSQNFQYFYYLSRVESDDFIGFSYNFVKF